MSQRTYTATRLKAELLGVLDEVAASGEPVLITKHGRSVARLVPVDRGGQLRGTVAFNVSDDDLVAPLDVTWHAVDE